FLEGAVKCDLYRGARDSMNPELNGRAIREVDLSLRVPDSIDPQDPAFIALVERTTNMKWSSNSDENGWGQAFRQSMLYGYHFVPDFNCDVEFELCIQRLSETCEISEYWDRIFTESELVEQRIQRNIAQSLGKDEYWAEKKAQNEEAKFRILY